MTEQNDTPTTEEPQAPPGPIVLGELLPNELAGITNFKQQADQVVHQLGVNRVQEHRMMDQLRRLEQGTNQIIQEAGHRLGIPDGTAWSVTSDGKAILVGAPPVAPAARPTLVPTPPPAEVTQDEGDATLEG